MRTLSQLLSDAWQTFQKSLSTTLILAILMYLCSSVAQDVYIRTAIPHVKDTLQRFNEKFAATEERAQKSDPTAVQEPTEGNAETHPEKPASVAGAAVNFLLGPSIRLILWPMLFIWLITSVAILLFLLLALNEETNATVLVNRSLPRVIPFLGLSLWVIIRSFVWIPIVGPIIALFRLPRFVLAPVIMLAEEKGLLESASESYRRSKGHSGKIFGNIFVAGIVAGMVAWIVRITIFGTGIIAMIASMTFSDTGASIANFVVNIVEMMALAYSTIFTAKLALEFRA
jgi:hypothetical protein